jgi:hypothetical protein
MKTTILLAAFGWCVAVAGASQPAATLFLDREGTPVVRYALSGPTSEGRFVDTRPETHKTARQQFWSYDKACLEVSARGMRKLAPTCGPAEVRLTWDEQARDRIYPGVVRLRNGGVLVATQYLQPLTDDGRLIDWEVRAPEGGVVVFRDQKSRGSIVLGKRQFEHDGRGYAYLGPDEFLETPSGRVFVDRGVPAAVSDEVLRVAPRLLAEMELRLGKPARQRPSLFLTWGDREGRNRQVQADVVPGAVIRFGVSGEAWGAAAPEAIAQMRKLVSHELVHLWNGEVFQPMSWAASWVSEGNAELLSLAALLAIGEMSPEQAAEHVAAAFNDCVLPAGGRSWSEMHSHEKHFGKAPYACGLAFQFAAVAAASRADEKIDAFEFWKRVWSEHPRYFEAVLPAYFMRSGQGDFAQAFGALFTDKSTPVEASLRRILGSSGIELTRAGASASALLILRQQLMATLMQADCQRGYSFNTFDDHYEIVEGAEIRCKTFRKGQRFRVVEGENPFERTTAAIAKANAACKTGGTVRLTADDGAALDAPCPASPFVDEGSLVRLAAVQVGRTLVRR